MGVGLSKHEYDPRNRWSLSGCTERTFLPLRAGDGVVCVCVCVCVYGGVGLGSGGDV